MRFHWADMTLRFFVAIFTVHFANWALTIALCMCLGLSQAMAAATRWICARCWSRPALWWTRTMPAEPRLSSSPAPAAGTCCYLLFWITVFAYAFATPHTVARDIYGYNSIELPRVLLFTTWILWYVRVLCLSAFLFFLFCAVGSIWSNYWRRLARISTLRTPRGRTVAISPTFTAMRLSPSISPPRASNRSVFYWLFLLYNCAVHINK